MKNKIRYFLKLLFLLLPAVLWGQRMGEINVRDISLREQSDSLLLEITFSVSGEVPGKGEGVKILPGIRSADGERELTFPSLLLTGKEKNRQLNRRLRLKDRKLLSDVPYIHKVVEPQKESEISYRYSLLYESWMDSAALSLSVVRLLCRDREQWFTLTGVIPVVTETFIPYSPFIYISYIEPSVIEKTREIKGAAHLDFEPGKSVIRPTYRRNPEELGKIEASIREVTETPDIRIDRIGIDGYASPDGSARLNERLSRDRADALGRYLSRRTQLPASLFYVTGKGEDWQGLKELVEQSSYADNNTLLSILDSNEDTDIKERRLKSLGGGIWPDLMINHFPSLRRVEYRIDYTLREYSLAEAEELLEKNPGHLSPAELFVLAESHGIDSEKFKEIILLSVLLYPDEIETNLNAAAVALSERDTETAAKYLEKIKDHPEAANNLGVWYLLKREVEEATACFEKAGGQSASLNLIETEKVKADVEKEKRRHLRGNEK